MMARSRILSLFYLIIFSLNGQENSNWVVRNVFDQKVFIENKGQFFIEKKLPSSNIKFGAVHEGLQYYFTKNSLIIEYVKLVRRSERELEELNELYGIKEKNEKEEEFFYKHVKEYYTVKFLKSNSEVEIVPERKQNFYQTYGFETIDKEKMSVKAEVFKKLIYKNIYPNIDLEFYFPEDRSGYKYNFVLHPGANPSDIKLKFENAESTYIKDNNLFVKSSFGNFVEREPQSYIRESLVTVKVKYKGNENEIGFDTEEYDMNKSLVIDPWVLTPSLQNGNRAYDIDYDNMGNVYVYGGGRPNFVLSKYGQNGNLLWSYICPALTDMYGDFAVDKVTGTCYLSEGLDFLCSFYKVNSLGTQTGFYNGSNLLNETGRIVFDPCTGKGYVIGGGSNGNGTRIASLDTNLTSMNFIAHVSSGSNDLNCLAIDYYGNSYQMNNLGNYYNYIFKVPLSNLGSVLWKVPDGYNFYEFNSYVYYNNQSFPSNGYNGISVSDKSLYTSNGSVLKKWNTINGALIDSLVMPTVPTGTYYEVFWGGLASNDCGYVLAGNKQNVLLYDPTFNLVQTFPQISTIYDIVLRNDGTVYVCGDNFVSVFNIKGINCINSAHAIIQPDSCNEVGTATLNISGGIGPYSISWNTSPPQTGSTANNLLPGQNYIVTINDNSCKTNTYVDTVKIINPFPYFSSVGITSVACGNFNDGKIVIDCSGGLAPYFYNWSNGESGSGLNSIDSLSAGTYSVHIVDAKNCPHDETINIPLIGNFSFNNYPKVNVFTPNGDGVNDLFFPFANNAENFSSIFSLMDRYELNIYDRWGLLVFTTTFQKDYWYGRTTSGIECAAGNYFWILSINSSCQDPVKQNISGFVQLIR